MNEEDQFAKFQEVLKLTTKLELSNLMEILHVDRLHLMELLLQWKDWISFKIDGDYLIVNEDSMKTRDIPFPSKNEEYSINEATPINDVSEQEKTKILMCYYHKERQAVTKCEQCGKELCFDCRKVWKSNYGNSNHSLIMELCKECFTKKEEEKFQCYIIQAIFVIIFLLVLFVR